MGVQVVYSQDTTDCAESHNLLAAWKRSVKERKTGYPLARAIGSTKSPVREVGKTALKGCQRQTHIHVCSSGRAALATALRGGGLSTEKACGVQVQSRAQGGLEGRALEPQCSHLSVPRPQARRSLNLSAPLTSLT